VVGTQSSTEYTTFFVGKKPKRYWDYDLHEKNLEYLRSLDPTYFSNFVDFIKPKLETDAKQHAALALRLTYFQALEAFFSHLCACLQAPTCIIGWMQSYRTEDLELIVKSINDSNDNYINPHFKKISWKKITTHIFRGLTHKRHTTIRNFAIFWEKISIEFLDTKNTLEYNSIKHGTRLSPGGFKMFIASDSPVNCPVEATDKGYSLGGSDFGSTFYIPEPLDGKKLHFQPKPMCLNWDPYCVADSIILLSYSLNNLVCYLRTINHDKNQDISYMLPSEDSMFNRPWENSIGVHSASFERSIHLKNSSICSKDVLLQELIDYGYTTDNKH